MVQRRLFRRRKGTVDTPPPSTPARKSAPNPVDLVLASRLFDHEWYALQAGCPKDRATAARHYVRKGRHQGLQPHPLFDPHRVARQFENVEDSEAFLDFLRRRRPKNLQTHALFDAKRYVRANPAARQHPHGALGHYLDFGAATGASPNSWYRPNPAEEPEGLADWIRHHGHQWSRRKSAAGPTWSNLYRGRLAQEFRTKYDSVTPREDPRRGLPLVSIIVPAGQRLGVLKDTLESVIAQSLSSWELIVLDSGGIPKLAEHLEYLSLERLRIIAVDAEDAAAMNAGVAVTTGEYVAWIHAGEVWHPDRLRLLVAVCQVEGADGAYDIAMHVAEGGRKTFTTGPYTQARFVGGARLLLSQLILRRAHLAEVGGFDDELPAAWDFDFAYRAFRDLALFHVPVRGTKRVERRFEVARKLSPSRRPNPYHDAIDSWHDVVINRYALDWSQLGEADHDSGVVTVIIPTYDDWRMTTRAVRAIKDAGPTEDFTVEVVIFDNGCAMANAVMLDVLAERFENVRVVHSPVNHGFALGNNLALSVARGSIVVFLNNDTEVQTGWLEPLLARLRDPEILGAQSLLLYPTGTIQSAGVAFPNIGGIPHAFLQGFPEEDARCLEARELHALTGAAMAMRFDDVVRLRGFDPVFRNGMEDVDICLRLADMREGHFACVPGSRVIHHESRSRGRFTKSVTNRNLYLERWKDRAPRDDHRLWSSVGLKVVGHELRQVVDEDLRLCLPEPVLAKEAVLHIEERPSRLRWAIKNPAPAGQLAESWGDTHFARRLAAALRDLGQDVVIDHRPEFARSSGRFDDVVLVLRGVAPYPVRFGQLNFLWLISHPEMLGRAEAAGYDRLFAASEPWSAKMSKAWNIRIDPLLQATDPALFHPDLAQPDTGHPALFIGGSRKVFRPIVKQAIEAGLPLSVYGSEWEPFIPKTYVKGQYVENREVGAMYRAAGVVLNDHWEDMRAEGFISNRLFDAAAAGGRVITDDVSGLNGLFGRSVQVARSVADLERLTSSNTLDDIFGDDHERRAVSDRIHREHSFAARARELMETALEERTRQTSRSREA